MSFILITGASEGLGSALARQLATRGHALILTARTESKLRELQQELLQLGASEVLFFPVDLSNPAGVEKLILALEPLPVGALINNAGAGLVGAFQSTDSSREKALMELLIHTPLRLTKWFLGRPQVAPGGLSGRIMNVASSGAYQPGAYTSVYYASKAFISSWSQALTEELKMHGILVTTLYPGALDTGFAHKAGKGLSPGARRAEWVAKKAVQGWLRGKTRIVPGWENRLLIALSRFLPEAWTAHFVGQIQTRNSH